MCNLEAFSAPEAAAFAAHVRECAPRVDFAVNPNDHCAAITDVLHQSVPVVFPVQTTSRGRAQRQAWLSQTSLQAMDQRTLLMRRCRRMKYFWVRSSLAMCFRVWAVPTYESWWSTSRHIHTHNMRSLKASKACWARHVLKAFSWAHLIWQHIQDIMHALTTETVKVPGVWLSIGAKSRSLQLPSGASWILLGLQRPQGAQSWLHRLRRISDITYAHGSLAIKLSTKFVNLQVRNDAAQHYANIAGDISSAWSVHDHAEAFARLKRIGACSRRKARSPPPILKGFDGRPIEAEGDVAHTWTQHFAANEAGAVIPKEDLAWFEAQFPACPEQPFNDLVLAVDDLPTLAQFERPCKVTRSAAAGPD
eukprot:7349331-Pyramimonas_sp.AAC.1